MNFTESKHRLDNSIVLQLLKADNAGFCLGFLRDIFRVERAVTRPQYEMVSRLTTVIMEINGTTKPERLPRDAKYYLDRWVEAGALVTRHADDNSVLYEITHDADQAILFLEQLGERPQNTRGAKSKLRAILESLQTLKDRANPDREARVRSIEKQIDALTEEKHRLLANAELRPDSKEQLLEEYQYAVDMARRLLADFTEIRRLFLKAAQDAAERYASTDVSRGVLLEGAIAAHRNLSEGEIGQSFNAFREYLSSSATQDSLFTLIKSTGEIPALAETVSGDPFLARVPGNLMSEAVAVVDQTRRLSSDLRRMLDAKAITARRETQEALAAIRGLAYAMADNPPEGDLLQVTRTYADTKLTEDSLRLPWRAPSVVIPMGESTPSPNTGKESVLAMFGELSAIEIARLQRQLDERLSGEDHGFRLTEMLDWYPPRNGEWLLDVIGYFELARHPRSAHVIRDSVDQLWMYTPPGATTSMRLPQIYFYK